MSAAPIHLAGERLMLDPAGALHWPARKLLAVADLHLEKGSSGARRGNLLPPWDTKETLDRLALLVRRYQPEILVADLWSSQNQERPIEVQAERGDCPDVGRRETVHRAKFVANRLRSIFARPYVCQCQRHAVSQPQ